MNNDNINIIIADDHDLFRQGMMSLLGKRRKINILGEANNGEDALALIEQHQPDVAILDVSMPKLTGLQICEKLQAKKQLTQIVILTMHDDVLLANEAIQKGASAYVLKDNSFDEVMQAIDATQQHEVFISPVIHSRQQTAPYIAPLTARETEVLTLIASGTTVRDIAITLSISTKSVDTYRQRLMKKLKLKNSAQLIQYATKRSLV